MWRSVCLFVLTLISAKIAKLIKMLFAVLTDVNPRYHLLSGIHMGATWQIWLNSVCGGVVSCWYRCSNSLLNYFVDKIQCKGCSIPSLRSSVFPFLQALYPSHMLPVCSDLVLNVCGNVKCLVWSDGVESWVHCLQALLTDMAAHSYVIDDINKMADEMIAANHGKTPAVKKRRDEINDRYGAAPDTLQ